MSDGQQLIGRTIAGRFRITGFIGEGAMAAVYRGEQDAEPRDVAIKIMHRQLLGDQTFLSRFRREAKAASRLNHANTVHIIDSGLDGRLPYIVMELVSGQDLFELLLVERRMSEARAARLMIQICAALSVAHEHGVVHRDLKPENVMVLRDPADPSVERVKVLDFGIAKMMEGGSALFGDEGPNSMPNSLSNTSLTTVGVVVGTPAYMSPEQCKGDPVDGRSDVYACGILLFLLVTGRLPFQPTAVAWEVAMDHLRRPPPAPSQFLPQIHPGLEAAILTALSKWPTQRQQSARELGEELKRLLPSLSDVLHTAGAAVALKDSPTMESMPVSIRSRVSAAPPFRAVDLLPAPPLASPGASPGDGERPAPPSVRAQTGTLAIPLAGIRGIVGDGATTVTRGRDTEPPPAQRRAGTAGADRGAPVVPVIDTGHGARPRGELPSLVEEPPSSEFVIHNRADLLLDPPPGGERADAMAPAREAGERPALTSVVAGVAVVAGVDSGARPAPASLLDSGARPALTSIVGLGVGTGVDLSARPAPAPIAEAPVLAAPRLPAAPPRVAGSWIERLVVPAAVVIGLALGTLAFFLTR